MTKKRVQSLAFFKGSSFSFLQWLSQTPPFNNRKHSDIAIGVVCGNFLPSSDRRLSRDTDIAHINKPRHIISLSLFLSSRTSSVVYRVMPVYYA